MNTIIDKNTAKKCQDIISEMMENGHHFAAHWLHRRNWKVVPVESAARLPEDALPRLVSVLNSAGQDECLALATEDLGDMPRCYKISISVAGLREFNRELGPFRFLLTDEQYSWAISCTEWYNLFAGEENLLEALLGMSIAEARKKFDEFARLIAKQDPADQLLNVARQYAE